MTSNRAYLLAKVVPGYKLSVCIELLNVEQHRTAGDFVTAFDSNTNCGDFTNLNKSLDIFLECLQYKLMTSRNLRQS